jgi:hypothetical protein
MDDHLPNQWRPDELSDEGLRREIPEKAIRLAIWLCLFGRLKRREFLQYLEESFFADARRIGIRRARQWYWRRMAWNTFVLAGFGRVWRIGSLVRAIVRLYTGV